ncbi:hypothetical protein [Escherichia phage UPEC06]|nr:hypothetical protein [Escherichia phage UPEC06]
MTLPTLLIPSLIWIILLYPTLLTYFTHQSNQLPESLL